MKAEAVTLRVSPGQATSRPSSDLRLRMAAKFHGGLRSRSLRYGLRRDLTEPLERPTAKIPIEVRPMVESDLSVLLAVDAGADAAQERLEIAWRRAFLDKGAKGCFVAVDCRDGAPCYMQWLMGADQNAFIRRLRSFPVLQPDEALLENAYTPVSHRGLGIMSAAMALIAERAAELGARYVLTFVDQANVPSLKGCQRAGFFPHMLHTQTRLGLGLLKLNSFEVFPAGDPRRNLRF